MVEASHKHAHDAGYWQQVAEDLADTGSSILKVSFHYIAVQHVSKVEVVQAVDRFSKTTPRFHMQLLHHKAFSQFEINFVNGLFRKVVRHHELDIFHIVNKHIIT